MNSRGIRHESQAYICIHVNSCWSAYPFSQPLYTLWCKLIIVEESQRNHSKLIFNDTTEPPRFPAFPNNICDWLVVNQSESIF